MEGMCINCKYVNKGIDEYPCTECARNYADKYKKQKRIDVVRDMSAINLAKFMINNTYKDAEELKKYLLGEIADGDFRGKGEK